MAEEALLVPIEGDDPCGPDLRWDAAFVALGRSLAAAVAHDDESVLDAELVRADTPTYEDIAEMARALCARTKDLRVFTVYAEALWRDQGLVAFAGAVETLASAVERWPGPHDGIHPRAAEEDDDLGERAAALGKLANTIPALVDIVGWGDRPEISVRMDCADLLKGVFDAWTVRLEPAFGPDLPSPRSAWNALRTLIGTEDLPMEAGESGESVEVAVAEPARADAWDLVERAAEAMAGQDRHSPALPVLRMLAGWRSRDIIDIAGVLKRSGISLEQLLESINKQQASQ